MVLVNDSPDGRAVWYDVSYGHIWHVQQSIKVLGLGQKVSVWEGGALATYCLSNVKMSCIRDLSRIPGQETSVVEWKCNRDNISYTQIIDVLSKYEEGQ